MPSTAKGGHKRTFHKDISRYPKATFIESIKNLPAGARFDREKRVFQTGFLPKCQA